MLPGGRQYLTNKTATDVHVSFQSTRNCQLFTHSGTTPNNVRLSNGTAVATLNMLKCHRLSHEG